MTRTTFIPFIGALLLLLLVLGLNVYWYTVVTDESTQVTTLAGEIQAKTNDSTRTAAAKSELAALSTDQASIEHYFVSTNDVVPYLEQLQTTGKYLGSNLQIVSVSAAPGTPYGKLSLALSIQGSFNSVLRTLGSVEYGPYDTSISTLALSVPQSTAASSSPQWTANAQFTVGTEVSAPITASVAAPAVQSTTTSSASAASTTEATSTTQTSASTTTGVHATTPKAI
jgi:hypothetical protein